jgi:hypothetical protein
MEWTTEFIADKNIVVIKTSGVADGKSSMEMAKSIAQIMEQHKTTRCLIDHSSLLSVSGDSTEIYYRPAGIRKTGAPSGVKIAEVVRPAHQEHLSAAIMASASGSSRNGTPPSNGCRNLP